MERREITTAPQTARQRAAQGTLAASFYIILMTVTGYARQADDAVQTRRDMPRGWVAVAQSDDIPDRGRLVVDVAGVEIGIFRLDGCLYAWENVCAHAGGPVCQGKMINRVIERLDGKKRSLGDDWGASMHIVCPWHGYEYDLRTGRHPADPMSQLRAVVVEETNGEILVEL